jgi:DNA end-binding protein Ku
MYTASQAKEISFTLLHKKDLSEIRYARMCKTEDKEVPWDEIVKGYEYESGNFVLLDDKDFEKANLKKTKTIEILNFVEEKEIESLYYVKPYYLEPDKNAEKA